MGWILNAWAGRAAIALFCSCATACGDDARKRPIGATCAVSNDCETALCHGGSCLDPAGDDDGDGLINGVEVDQGSDPLAVDTDGDGIPDPDEYDGLIARDSDGDGVPDALESALLDNDGDCLADQHDPNEGVDDGACDPLALGLIGHWRLDGDGLDSGPLRAHGAVHGASPTADRFGRAGAALAFVADGDRVEVLATAHPLSANEMTYALWVRPGPDSRVTTYFAFGDVSASGRASGLGRDPDSGCTRYLSEAGAGADHACAPDAHWTHLALVRSGPSLSYYMDGRLVGTGASTATLDLAHERLVIGSTGGDAHASFRGVLDDLRVWGRALEATEIAAIYREGDWPDAGTEGRPARSCLHALESTGDASDGPRWIDSDGDGAAVPLSLHCDMHTAGGGWALVWVYGFTAIDTFTAPDNAVTPRPSWPAEGADVPISTDPPSAPDTPGALAWEAWRGIGASFMVLSDLNDGIACDPIEGSLVNGTSGPVACRTVADVTPTCDGVVPEALSFGARGPSLSAATIYYYFDGSTSADWPTHDPCGQNTARHIQDPTRWGGAIYLRPTRSAE